MDYQRAYDALIDRAANRAVPVNCYTERHHIIPKCMGGDDVSSNIVVLHAREHFIAHLLLVKMYPQCNKLIYAAHMLTRGTSKHGRYNNREYQWLKEIRATALSALHKGVPKSESHKQNMRGKRPHVNQTGVNNNAFKGFIHTPYGVFESLSEAAAAENTIIGVIHYRIHSSSDKFKEYKRVSV